MGESREARLRELERVVAELPASGVREVLDFATYLRSRQEWDATQELLAEAGMRADVQEGRDQARQGRGKPWQTLRKKA